MTDGVSNEPVVSAPAPISVEPRSAAPAEVAEVARQAEEAKLPSPASKKDEPAKAPAAEEKAKPRPSIREALAAAREKLDAEPATPLKVAAKEAPAAKAAEPAPKDAPAAKEPAVAAKAADAKAAEPVAKVEPARAEDGKFVSTKEAEPAVAAKDAPPAAEPAKPSHTASAPPARFSAAAKEKWAEAPEEVRAETERAVSELTKGFEKHRAAAESFEHVREFDEMAKRGNTTLKEALSKYVGMEQQLRADPVKGLELIAKNVGLNLQELAAKVLGKTPDQARVESDATIQRLEAKIANLEKGIGTIHQERQQAATDTTTASVTAFAAANPRFEELADDISFFLKSGKTKDLAEAYKLAERLNPAPAAPAPAPTPTPAAAASSAPAVRLVPPAPASTAGEKSIAGTPTAGSDPVRKQPSNSIREAIRKATAAAR